MSLSMSAEVVTGTRTRYVCMHMYNICLIYRMSLSMSAEVVTGTRTRSATAMPPCSPATMPNFLPSLSAGAHSRSRTCVYMHVFVYVPPNTHTFIDRE